MGYAAMRYADSYQSIAAPDSERADRRHEAIVRELAKVLETYDMHDAMIESLKCNDEWPSILFSHPMPLDESAALSAWRIAAVRFVADDLKIYVNRRNRRLDAGRDEIADAAPDATYYRQNGCMP
jgi:hypothetical protein